MIYICGDSFSVSDAEYGPCWVDLLAEKVELTNLSAVAASNLQISIQVDYAIKHNASFIIYQATSCVRNDVAFSNSTGAHLLDRYTNIVSNDKSKSLVSYSAATIENACKTLTASQLSLLKQYYIEFFDIDLAVFQNQMIIEGTLSKLIESKIPFVFSQGGFEHPKFTKATNTYFLQYSYNTSKINLWDFTEAPLTLRPYYHITDQQIHQTVAEYYYDYISTNNISTSL